MTPPLLQFSLVAFTSIFALVDPIAAVPTFLVMTAHTDRDRRSRTALRASWTCFIVLAIFALAGPLIFQMFGITLPSFKIAGGVVLGLIGLDMLRARRSPTKETPGDAEEGTGKEDPGITPLGVPMLAGPGAMSSVTVLMTQNADWAHRGVVLAAVATASLVSFLILAAADRVGAYLHETGIRILSRLMGLLLTAIAVQFILDGLRDVGRGAVMAINRKPVDVVVIGLGAAGGVAVLPLARAGLKVAGIEAGGWMDPHSFKPDEIYNNVRRLVTSVPKAQREIPTVRSSSESPARQAAVHPMMNAIGGTSIHYWAQSWRLKPWDFKTRSETIRRYGVSAIPGGSTLEDWPIGYDDLEPFYDTVEYEIGVSGKAGNIQGRIDPDGNVFEGPRRREYPMPPLRGTEFSEHMADAARKLGWKPFRAPAAINSQLYKGRPGCAYHGFCGTGGCHIGAKNSTAVTTIPEAQKTKNLTIVDHAHVTRIVSGADGLAVGVLYLKEGKEYFQPAKVVLLASYTYENSRLLLLSKSKAYPNGLSNNHGQVGRHYFGHWGTAGGAAALFPFDINVWYGLPAQGTTVDEWADDNYDHSGLGFIGGTSLHVHTELHPIDAAAMPTFGRAPGWGSGWKSFVRQNAARYTSAYLQTSTFPYEATYLDLDTEVRDPLGDPVCRVTTGPKENETRSVQYAQKKMEEWFRTAGAVEVFMPPPLVPGLSTHAFGGTRMGDNAETNVVDRWGFSHEARNLGILGASLMGTSGARNPTLTIQALAWRTAEHLVKNWKAIAG